MNTELRELILKLIEKNSRLAIHDLAVMLDVAETEVANEIADMEKEHIICGYHTLINWDNTSKVRDSTALQNVFIIFQK